MKLMHFAILAGSNAENGVGGQNLEGNIQRSLHDVVVKLVEMEARWPGTDPS